MHTAEPLVIEPSSFEVQIDIIKLKRQKPSGTHQILAEMIQAEGNILSSEIHKLLDSFRNKELLPQQCKKSNVVPTYKMGGRTDCIITESATE